MAATSMERAHPVRLGRPVRDEAVVSLLGMAVCVMGVIAALLAAALLH
jgi:hypothetical protein